MPDTSSKIIDPPPDSEAGLYGKYEVHKLRRTVHENEHGGRTTLVERVDPGPVFVLAYTKDPHARVALAAYADSCEAEYPQLAADLREQLDPANTEAVCKHCDLRIERRPAKSRSWLHAEGLQQGMHTCAVSPYGFHAEPVGTPCGDHPANACNGARGFVVKPT